MRFSAGPHPSMSTRCSSAQRFLRKIVCCGVLSGAVLFAQKSEPATPTAEQELQQHYAAARTFQVSGDNDRAAAEYRAFLGAALNRAGNARFASGEVESATSLYERALAVAPENADVRLSYAFLLQEQQKFDEAEKLATEVVKTSPKNVQALVLLGRIAYRKGDYKAAREYLE